ncbi:hypothetical protein Tco_1093434 [Tanacetum coccineum]|uniref:Uncharacterized protein n=1 Tax=Tanacetum coccineum TaxID=301880 RepID=A0ABQ5IDW2_9ASTR
MKAIIKEQVQAQVSKIMPKIEKYVPESLEAEVLVKSTNQPQTSYAVAASLSEFELKKILINKMETNKSIYRSETQKNLYNVLVESYNTDKDIITSYGDVFTLKRGRDDQDKDEDPISAHAEEHDQKAVDLEYQSHQEFNIGNEDVSPTVDNRPPQHWITQIAQAAGTQSSFNEFLATPIDFSAFIMHWLKIDNLTQEVLTDPTYDLIKGTCKSVVELEYHLKEVYKATNDQLDCHNPEGKPYPHDLSKPLPLILNEQGRQVIPLDHFINNDIEYLKGGSSSKKYTTSITKTKAVDYGQVKWIKDKVSRIWSLVKVVYDKHAYWGTYHWGPKCQKFYGYASNMETSKDVYSKHRIIVVTSLKIMSGLDEMNRNRLMCTDELHKFSDGTLNHVRTALNDIDRGIKMDYLPKRK